MKNKKKRGCFFSLFFFWDVICSFLWFSFAFVVFDFDLVGVKC